MKNDLTLISSVAVFLTMFLASAASAEEGSKYSEIARERQYVGGKDESDLKVQQVTVVNPKNKPVTDPQESNEGF